MRAGGRAAFFVCLALSLLSGCRSNELVETELRVRDNQFREALEEVGKLEAHNNALQRELEAVRGGAPLTPETAAVTFGLKRIVLGRGTGGFDNDGLPGDEALQVVLEPRDGDDHTVKTPGMLHISVLEITPQGLKKPLCWWQFGPEQLRTSWKQGLLSTGYTLLLPWTVFPSLENVRIVAQMKLSDGRVFETDKDVKVRVVPGAPRLSEAPPPLPPPPLLPPPAPLLPGPPSSEPFLVPTSSSSNASTVTRWAPAPLQGSVRIGRPEAVASPAVPPAAGWR